jgi:ribose/xylose/arabinose/galactoside ABC-type transport system permease subunit
MNPSMPPDPCAPQPTEAVPARPSSLPPPVAVAAPGLLCTLVPQLIWEAVLLVAVIVVLIGLGVDRSAAITKSMLPAAAAFGFMAAGLALSLRTATPNLAVGSIGATCGYLFAKQVTGGTSTIVAGLIAVLAAIGIGLVLAAIAGLTALPSWAVTLAAGFIMTGVLVSGTVGGVALRRGPPGPGIFTVWLIVFAIGSVAGGVALTIPGIRAALSRNRPDAGDVPGRFSPAKLIGAAVGLVGSSALAGLAGVIGTDRLGFAQVTDGGTQLAYAMAAVLIGGVSLLGARGGVFGVLLGVLLVQGLATWLALHAAKSGTIFIVVGAVAVAGVLVNWLLELVARLTAPKDAILP